MIERPDGSMEEWRAKRAKFIAERSAEYAAAHPEEQPSPQALDVARRQFAPVLRAVAKIIIKEVAAVRSEIDVAKEHLRREFRLAHHRKRRWKKMTKAEADSYVMSKRGLPERAFDEPRGSSK